MEQCKTGCTYSRSMNQVYPRRCEKCGHTEPGRAQKKPEEIPAQAKMQIGIGALTEALIAEPDYKQAWADNIATAFKDQFGRDFPDANINVHETANKAASNFLNNFCGIVENTSLSDFARK